MTPPRVRVPALKEGFTAQDLILWLGACEDAFESVERVLAEGEVLSEGDKIREAGMRMEGVGQLWWSSRRKELKALASWDLFEKEVRGRFLSAGLTLAGMHTFHLLQQSGEFSTFASGLVAARNLVGLDDASRPVISDEVFKNHLLHRSDPLLYARVTSTPTFTLTTFTVDSLTQHMLAVWEGLRLEAQLRRPSRPSSSSATTPLPSSSSSPRLAPLTEKERVQFRQEGRCYKCRTIGHLSPDCPLHMPTASPSAPEVKQEPPSVGLRALHLATAKAYQEEEEDGFEEGGFVGSSESESDDY